MILPFLVISSICTGLCVGAIGKHYLKEPNRDKFQIIISNVIFYGALPSIFLISYLVRNEIEKQTINDMITGLEKKIYDFDVDNPNNETAEYRVRQNKAAIEPILDYLRKCKRDGIPKVESDLNED